MKNSSFTVSLDENQDYDIQHILSLYDVKVEWLMPPGVIDTIITKRCHRVVNSPASYSGGPRFKSRPLQPASLTDDFCGFPQSLQTNPGIVP
jgi:hypothetical protein